CKDSPNSESASPEAAPPSVRDGRPGSPAWKAGSSISGRIPRSASPAESFLRRRPSLSRKPRTPRLGPVSMPAPSSISSTFRIARGALAAALHEALQPALEAGQGAVPGGGGPEQAGRDPQHGTRVQAPGEAGARKDPVKGLHG